MGYCYHCFNFQLSGISDLSLSTSLSSPSGIIDCHISMHTALHTWFSLTFVEAKWHRCGRKPWKKWERQTNVRFIYILKLLYCISQTTKLFFIYRANTIGVLHVFKFDNRIDLIAEDQTNAHKILLTALWLPHYTFNPYTYTLTHVDTHTNHTDIDLWYLPAASRQSL